MLNTLPKCSKYILTTPIYKQICSISTTATCNLNQAFRKQKGLPLNPNTSGPLTDLPDYSYLDGRPVPLGLNQKRRMNKRIELTKKIISLSQEIDFAVERHDQKLKNEQKMKQSIIDNKLKPKGHLLKVDK